MTEIGDVGSGLGSTPSVFDPFRDDAPTLQHWSDPATMRRKDEEIVRLRTELAKAGTELDKCTATMNQACQALRHLREENAMLRGGVTTALAALTACDPVEEPSQPQTHCRHCNGTGAITIPANGDVIVCPHCIPF